MATFANQSSNLSALSSALTSFSEILDVSDDAASKLTKAEDEEYATLFLETQRLRVDAIDDSLLEATEDILPVSPDAKTVTEMAELCRLVQEATRQKMGLLRTRLELLGVKTSWKDSIITSPKAVVALDKGSTQTQIEWSIGRGPLDCVIEADLETEGATTPGSLLQPSPLFGSTSKRKASLTPTTPTMNKFSFSSSTASILEKMSLPASSSSSKRRTPVSKGVKASPSPSSANSRRSERHLNFEGFQEEDDMISLNTTVEAHSNNALAASPSMKMKEERSQFLARMESMLERVEEELIHECRPSDETSGISRKSSVAPQMERPSNNKFLEEMSQQEEDDDDDDDDSDSVDDDSTNMIATLVADKPEPMGRDIQRPIPVFHRPTHILVDTGAGASSPAHTNLTMDATMMNLNDTMISTSVIMQDIDDNDSTVTPILDRYRLDPDDNSIGVRVVPNKRGNHHGQSAFVSESSHQVAASKTEFYTDNDGFMSPKGLPGSVSARKTKQYRKTPFPKKQLEQSFDDENHPNTRTALNFSPASSTTSFDASNPDSSFSVPPLRPRSFGPTRTGTRTSNSRSNSSSTSRTQSLPARSTLLPKTPDPMKAVNDISSNVEEFMEKITMAEYNMAPRVVQMHVTRDQANRTIDELQALFESKYHAQQALEFSEEEGYRALSNVMESEQKSKSVLTSLCHWKRLLMYRDASNRMLFAVNKFEQ